MTRICIQGIEIPVDADTFTPADFEQVMDFYPSYAIAASDHGVKPYAPQPYLIEVCKQLSKIDGDGVASVEGLLKAFLSHFGFSRFSRWLNLHGVLV